MVQKPALAAGVKPWQKIEPWIAVFLSFSCIRRSDDVHKDRWMRLVGDLSAKTRQYRSKVWGINGASPLQGLDF